MSGILGQTGDTGLLGTIPSYASLSAESEGNYNYIKYPNGVLICWTNFLSSNASANVTWTFPHAFKSGTHPSVSGGSKNAITRWCVNGIGDQTNGATGWTFWAYGITARDDGGANNPATTDYVWRSTSEQLLRAIGRWK